MAMAMAMVVVLFTSSLQTENNKTKY